MLAGHLADRGELDRIASLTLAVTVLDQYRAGLPSAVANERVAAGAIASSASRGYLDGHALAEVFAWLRPGDLIWNYWVNNYLQGRKPPPFDVLYWNADTTRMTAALHRDFVELGMANSLIEPGAAKMLGSPVDLSKVTVPAYVVAGIADHICPWQACYRSTQLLGGETRFVLSTSGHIASMVNPPGNPKATFQVNDENPADPAVWLKTASTEPGTWWPDYVGWLADRSGDLRAAPAALGGGGLEPMEAAPGTYVFDA
jgi:polyhydroxyalkanoate synthase subunit PhaC